MARDSYGRICRPGFLAVSPQDYDERPEQFDEQAREKLRTDNAWLAEQIAESVDDVVAELLTDTGYHNDAERDRMVCERLRAAVNAAIERETPDLADKLWQSAIESSQQAAAEYAADRD